FYAMVPVIFPLFLLPKSGVGALRGYLTGFFYLAAWGPLYVVLHMILMSKGLSAGLAVANGGATLGNFAGIGAINDETATLAGYMIATIPFLAAGMARGAMAISSHATSFLAPSQNAAEAAALEATTGNYAYGNASLGNSTINTQSRDQWSTQPSFSSGAPAFAFRQSNGVDRRAKGTRLAG
ncbi:MAG: conjugal transfer protein TraG N-terminal domain-containing protein, partial [Thiobacillus sp.]